MQDDLDMKGDWNERAKANAAWYIATSVDGGEDAFDDSGRNDVALFFDGLEHLLHGEQDVVDLGCGIGRMDRHVAPRVRTLTGVDVSGEMVRQASKRLQDLPNVRFVEVDGFSFLPLPDAGFGLVFSHIVLQHTPRDVTVGYLEDAFRILRPGGSMVFQMPEAVPGAPADPPREDTFEMRFWSEQDLREVLDRIGFIFRDCRRFPVQSEHLDFNQLRLHAEKPAH